jgi:hypothetical protein
MEYEKNQLGDLSLCEQYKIKIWDDEGNKTNTLTISEEQFEQIKRILLKA